MRILDHLLHGDEEGRSPEVRALHAAMRKASGRANPTTLGALYELLAGARLWTVIIGPPPELEGLTAQALTTGPSAARFRTGFRRSAEAYLPAATTRFRMARSGIWEPGDTMVRLPFRFLAAAAHANGYSIVLNPVTKPTGYLAGPAVTAFAAGGIPDPLAPPARR